MRFRHDWCSDPCRIKRQQQVLHAMSPNSRAIKSTRCCTLGNLLAIFRRTCRRISPIRNCSRSHRISRVCPTIAIVNAAGSVHRRRRSARLWRLARSRRRSAHAARAEMLLAPPSPEPSPDVMALAAIARRDAARRRRERQRFRRRRASRRGRCCKRAGFTIGTVGNADRSDYAATEIHEHSTVTFAGAKVRAALPAQAKPAVVVPDPAPSAFPSAAARDERRDRHRRQRSRDGIASRRRISALHENDCSIAAGGASSRTADGGRSCTGAT